MQNAELLTICLAFCIILKVIIANVIKNINI